MDPTRLKHDVCARAELYIVNAHETAVGGDKLTEIWRAAKRLEWLTEVEDDWDAVNLAFDYYCHREGIPTPKIASRCHA